MALTQKDTPSCPFEIWPSLVFRNIFNIWGLVLTSVYVAVVVDLSFIYSFTLNFFPIFVQYTYSTVTLHNRFSGLDARALQSGLQRFCEFFGGGAGGAGAGGHFGSSPLMMCFILLACSDIIRICLRITLFRIFTRHMRRFISL